MPLPRKSTRIATRQWQEYPGPGAEPILEEWTKELVMGLKAIVAWMAATPMWNGGRFRVILVSLFLEYAYNADRWVKAKDAAKAVIDFKVDGRQRYSLYQGHDAADFRDDAGVNNNNSKVPARLWDLYHDMQAFQNEAVFLVTRDKDNNWQGDIYPPSWGGSSRQMPVQEQVDEYEYIAANGYGYPVYGSRAKSDGYDDGNPYESVKEIPASIVTSCTMELHSKAK